MSGLYPSVAQLVERLTVVCRYCVSVYSEINWSPVRFWSFGSFLPLSLSLSLSLLPVVSCSLATASRISHLACYPMTPPLGDLPAAATTISRSSPSSPLVDRQRQESCAVACCCLSSSCLLCVFHSVSSCLVLSRLVSSCRGVVYGRRLGACLLTAEAWKQSVGGALIVWRVWRVGVGCRFVL